MGFFKQTIMIKDSLVFKIFIRFLKEKNMFHVFKKTISNDYFMELDNFIKIHNCSLTSLALFSHLNLNNDYYKILYNFFFKRENINEFTDIVSFYTKKFINKFLEEEKIKRKFVINLYELNYIDKDIKIKSFKSSKHGNKLINLYIDELLENKYILVGNFFFSAFSWQDTPQGYSYWADINLKYKNYMSQNLLNKQ